MLYGLYSPWLASFRWLFEAGRSLGVAEPSYLRLSRIISFSRPSKFSQGVRDSLSGRPFSSARIKRRWWRAPENIWPPLLDPAQPNPN